MRGGAGGRANGGAGEGEAGPRGGQILFGSPGILLGKIYLCIHANTRARTHTHTHTRERERSREGGGVELGGGVRKVVGVADAHGVTAHCACVGYSESIRL